MKRARAGLSLLEMLVALALMAVVATGLVASLNLGIRSYERVQTLDALQPELARRVQLRRLLAAAVSLDRLSNFPLTFDAQARRLSFVTFASTPFDPSAAAMRVTLSLGDEIKMQLDMLDDNGQVTSSHTGLLAHGVTNARLSYFDRSSGVMDWRDSWGSPDRLPTLVRITADSGSSPEWPEMIVRLHQSVSQ